jgi:hypothetical protein
MGAPGYGVRPEITPDHRDESSRPGMAPSIAAKHRGQALQRIAADYRGCHRARLAADYRGP